VVKALNRKLLRDLSRLQGQIVTVALVVAAGLSSLVGIYSTLNSIEASKDAYYERNRFADVFVHAKKAPEALEPRLVDIPGVQTLETRVTEAALIPLEGMVEPARGQVVSLPAGSEPALNSLHLTMGRMLRAEALDEVIVLDAFAEAHELRPGDTLPVVMGGRQRDLRIVGLAMSPEFVFFSGSGEIVADPERNAALWLNREAVEAAYGLDGSFNDVVVGLQPGASAQQVITELDRLLEPYGGLGAVPRKRQASHAVVTQEISQLRSLGAALPLAFLAVAAFLLNVVLSRLVQLQRGEIATLKAVGYGDRQIAAHFFGFVLVIVAIGAVLGLIFGAWLGDYMTGQYADYFRFPGFEFRVDFKLVVLGVAVALVVGVGGAFGTLYRVMRLPPAEAMRPPAPEVYRATLLERLGLSRWLSASTRMIVRDLERHPFRFLVSWFGLAVAVSLLVFGRFGWDGLERIIELQFTLGQREDIAVSFTSPLSERAERSLESLPGVLEVEAHRQVPVRWVAGHRYRDSVLVGYPEYNELRRPIAEGATIIRPPEQGVLISRQLGEILGVEAGDTVVVEVREGDRERFEVKVMGLADDTFGLFGYMQREALDAKLQDAGAITSAYLRVDSRYLDEVFRRLEDMPAVESAQRSSRILETFREQIDESVSFQTLVIVIIASVIVIGVVYNNTRVALSMRGRELASLRVLGFTRREVAYILLAEQAIQVVLALPVGFVLGAWFAELLVATMDQENFRFPMYISPRTFAFTTVVTLVSALFSGYLVRRKLDRMDLTEVLKERE
jgi:putative ABC transport system permease protein